MKSELLNQLKELRAFILIDFDETLEIPPYIKRPVRFWLDTPKGRIQMTAGGCWNESLKVGDKTYVALANVELHHDAYEAPNDFINKLMDSYEVTPKTKMKSLLTRTGISEAKIEAYKDEEETMPIRPIDLFFSIGGPVVPLTEDFIFTPTAPKRG